MSFEYQKLEVSNESASDLIQWMCCFGWRLKNNQRIFNRSSRPVGALSYQNFTYIHSVNEVEDFTELLFERDLNMPNYDEVRMLEEEANELLEYHTEQRPLPLPQPKPFDEWCKSNKPSPYSWGKRIKIAAILTVILSSVLTIVLAIITDESVGDILSPVFLVSMIVSSMITWLMGSFVRGAVKNNPDSPSYKKIYGEYEAYCNSIKEKNLRVELYDRAVVRIPEIIEEVTNLLQ